MTWANVSTHACTGMYANLQKFLIERLHQFPITFSTTFFKNRLHHCSINFDYAPNLHLGQYPKEAVFCGEKFLWTLFSRNVPIRSI